MCIITHILLMTKLKLKEVKWSVQTHSANEWQSWDLNWVRTDCKAHDFNPDSQIHNTGHVNDAMPLPPESSHFAFHHCHLPRQIYTPSEFREVQGKGEGSRPGHLGFGSQRDPNSDGLRGPEFRQFCDQSCHQRSLSYIARHLVFCGLGI